MSDPYVMIDGKSYPREWFIRDRYHSWLAAMDRKNEAIEALQAEMALRQEAIEETMRAELLVIDAYYKVHQTMPDRSYDALLAGGYHVSPHKYVIEFKDGDVWRSRDWTDTKPEALRLVALYKEGYGGQWRQRKQATIF